MLCLSPLSSAVHHPQIPFTKPVSSADLCYPRTFENSGGCCWYMAWGEQNCNLSLHKAPLPAQHGEFVAILRDKCSILDCDTLWELDGHNYQTRWGCLPWGQRAKMERLGKLCLIHIVRVKWYSLNRCVWHRERHTHSEKEWSFR